jgi:hemin uptake protein HemP
VTPPASSRTESSASRQDERGTESIAPGQQPPVDSATLLRGARSVEIRHNGEIYRLQATRLGKLILTK